MSRRLAAGCVVALAVSLLPAAPIDGEPEFPDRTPAQLLALGLIRNAAGPCGPDLLEVLGRGTCTHGPDRQSLHTSTLSSDPSGPETSAMSQQVTCSGNGTRGRRISAIYAYANGGFSSTRRAVIRRYASKMDDIMETSAAASPGATPRNFRFLHDGQCRPIIKGVRVSQAALFDFGRMIRELIAKGHNRNDRRYHVWADISANQSGICGIGETFLDTRPQPASNLNNNANLALFARTDRGCWGGVVEAHEVAHALGVVQDNAPNRTAAGHCTDDNDIMCYRDHPTTVMQVPKPCPAPARERMYDCNNDDYFHTGAPAGYLANNWNMADSSWLDGSPAHGPMDVRAVRSGRGSVRGSTFVGAVRIRNTGPGRTLSNQLRFAISRNTTLGGGDRFLGRSFNTRALGPGTSVRVAVNVPLPARGWRGRYLLAIADGSGVMQEIDENNNVVVVRRLPR